MWRLSVSEILARELKVSCGDHVSMIGHCTMYMVGNENTFSQLVSLSLVIWIPLSTGCLYRESYYTSTVWGKHSITFVVTVKNIFHGSSTFDNDISLIRSTAFNARAINNSRQPMFYGKNENFKISAKQNIFYPNTHFLHEFLKFGIFPRFCYFLRKNGKWKNTIAMEVLFGLFILISSSLNISKSIFWSQNFNTRECHKKPNTNCLITAA